MDKSSPTHHDKSKCEELEEENELKACKKVLCILHLISSNLTVYVKRQVHLISVARETVDVIFVSGSILHISKRRAY